MMQRHHLQEQFRRGNAPSVYIVGDSYNALVEPIGNIPPARSRSGIRYYAALEANAVAVQLTKISLRQIWGGLLAKIRPADNLGDASV